jgi:hypothetical protein
MTAVSRHRRRCIFHPVHWTADRYGPHSEGVFFSWRRTVRTVYAIVLAFGIAAPAAAQQVVQLPARDASLSGTPSLVYAVGTASGRSWEMFGRIVDVAFDADDHAYVLDAQATRVFVFDERGGFVREFGRRGGGPGELRTPVAIEVTANRMVAVLDVAGDVTLFHTSGDFVARVVGGEQRYGTVVELSALNQASGKEAGAEGAGIHRLE